MRETYQCGSGRRRSPASSPMKRARAAAPADRVDAVFAVQLRKLEWEALIERLG